MNWRILTLLLIAANFIYWAWNTWIYEPQNNLMNHDFNADTPELVIVDEVEGVETALAIKAGLDKDEQVPLEEGAVLNTETSLSSLDESAQTQELTTAIEAGVDNAGSTTAAITVCHRVGYFVDKAEVDKAQAWLITENIYTTVKSSTESIFAGYWVHLPAYPNSAAASQVVDALQEKNIKDLFVETRLPNKNAISLGLFRQRNGAEQRLKQIQALGFPAKINNREHEQTVHWLEFELDQQQVPPLARIPVNAGQVRRLERQDCLLEDS